MRADAMLDSLDARGAGARRLAGKVCIVTGAGQGIGRATARRFAAEGAMVVVAERIDETASETVRQLEAAGAPVLKMLADLSRLDEAQRLVQETVAHWGGVDVLVNVVGGTIWWQPYDQYDETQVQLELQRSLFPTLWGCHAVLPTMLAQQSGSIVNLSSAVVRGGLYRAPYATAKGGIEALTKSLAAEYGRHGIRVNALSPGSTAVPDRVTSRLTLAPGVSATPAEKTAQYFDEARGDLGRLALQRQSQADEQAAVIAFLASDDAAYVTGQIVNAFGDP